MYNKHRISMCDQHLVQSSQNTFVPWVYARLFAAWPQFRLRPRLRLLLRFRLQFRLRTQFCHRLQLQFQPRVSASQISGSEYSSLEEQMRGRLRSCRGSAKRQRAQRSTGLAHGVLAIWYVFVSNGAFNLNLIVSLGSTRPHNRGWMATFLSATANHEGSVNSMAATILRMN